MTPPPRTPSQRKKDTLNRLEHDTDAWVATADRGSGTPYLVPLSFLWDGTTLLIATPSSSPTSRNLHATGKVRLAIGPTRDLVLIEGSVHPLRTSEISDEVGDAHRCAFRPGGKTTSSRTASSCGADAGSFPSENSGAPPLLLVLALDDRLNDLAGE